MFASTEPSFANFLAITRQAFSKKLCLAPPSLHHECSGNIIRAHSVQRGGDGLKRIADNGHVDGTEPKFGKIPSLARIGINKASTFTGFCGKHDTSLFLPLEMGEFTGSDLQIFLLTYRALCRELYVKRGSITQSSEIAGLDIHEAVEAMIHDDLYASDLSLAELLVYKTTADAMLLNGDTSQLRHYMFSFDEVPQVMCNSWSSAEFDFLGRIAQHITVAREPVQGLAFNMLGTKTGGAAIFSWIDRGSQEKRMTESLEALTDLTAPDDLVRFCFEFCENIYLGPKWWATVPKDDADRLMRRIVSGTPFGGERSRHCLIGDGVKSATWKVVSRSRKP